MHYWAKPLNRFMAKALVNKKVLRKAEALVAEGKRPEPAADQPLPVCSLYYPRHGDGEPIQRFVRVLEMTNTHVKGFEIASEFDEEPGKPHTYRLDKVGLAGVLMLHMAKPVK